jgi:hypothetical protein
MQLSWNDPRLSLASDSRRTARYRLLQSWFREQVLQARYGEFSDAGGERPLSSLLHIQDVRDRPALNFVTPRAADYARQRGDIVVAAGGRIDREELTQDMLSSLSMSYSIFGELRLRADRGLDVVQAFFDPQAVAVELMECSWRPAIDVFGDRGSFDAAIITTRRDGSRHLVGIEAKYAEPFNPTIYNSYAYRQMHEYSGWFRPGTARAALGPATNQLWRHSLLAAACAQDRVMGISSASVAVLCLAEDPGAARALAGISATLRDPQRHCRIVSLEALVAGLREGIGPGPGWANTFATRYLDPPLMHAELPDLSSDDAEQLDV